jgi:hypothetical protein
MISQERLKYLFEYRDGELFHRVSRGTKKAGSKAGTLKPDSRIHVCVDKKLYLLHRVIFAMHNGFWPEMVDHIDGNWSNNKIENLRAATHAQNAWNAKSRKDNVVGIKNITYRKDGMYHIRIQANKTRVYLGAYQNVGDAQRAAINARNNLHKEFARHGNVMTAEAAQDFVATLP